jgi:hypothetical protein
MAVRPNAQAVARLTAQIQSTLEMLVADFPDQARPGRIGRWLTELFNDWPDGSRPPDQVRRIDPQAVGTITER